MFATRESKRRWSSHFLPPEAVGHEMVFMLQELHSNTSEKKGVACLFPLRLLTLNTLSRVVFQQLTVYKLSKKHPPHPHPHPPPLYGSRRFIIVFTKASHLSKSSGSESIFKLHFHVIPYTWKYCNSLASSIFITKGHAL
jgi:hypothetical protein